MANATVTGKIKRVERLGTSYYGNPYYMVAIETPAGEIELLRTSITAGINYAIGNAEYRDELHDFKLTAAGRVSNAVRTPAAR